jgi:hypothetical protein
MDETDPSLREGVEIVPSPSIDELAARRTAIAAKIDSRTSGRYARFILAVLGSIPWVGSLLSATAALQAEIEQDQLNEMQELWLQEHQAKLAELGGTIGSILSRFEDFGEEIQDRIQSEPYLALVRKAARSWDQADTKEKKDLLRKLLLNAGGTKLCSDDLVRLFIAWIDSYHESHFAVIREIYRNPRTTRGVIWKQIHGAAVREDSAEADLFKLLIRDLSTGGVIRQERATTDDGQYVRQAHSGPRGRAAPVLESAFENTKPYVLTELGQQFVHYTMDDLVPRVAGV